MEILPIKGFLIGWIQPVLNEMSNKTLLWSLQDGLIIFVEVLSEDLSGLAHMKVEKVTI